MKIIDGIIIQPGTWSTSAVRPPQKIFSPNLGDYPRIRIHFRGPITSSFQILLTGFTIRSVVRGVTGLDSATNSTAPQDGDFLGPISIFPWAAKVVFSIPSSYVAYFTTGAYERKLPITDDPAVVKDTAVIDMKTTQPETYYKTNHSGARVNVDVDEFTTLGDGTAVLTVYQKSEKYPPAIWGHM